MFCVFQPVCLCTNLGAAVRGSAEMSGRGCAEERNTRQWERQRLACDDEAVQPTNTSQTTLQLPGETPNLELLVCQKPASACVGRPKTSNYFVYPQVGQPWILVTELKNIPSTFQWQFWGRRSSGPASDSSNRSCKGWSRSPHELCPSFALHSWQSHCQILDISTISLSDFFCFVWLSPTIYIVL